MPHQKVARPHQPAVVLDRPEFFSELHSLRERPVIWVYGPPGSGKTTGVNSWLYRQNRPCLWYRLGTEDHDASCFFRFLSAAALGVCSASNLSLPVFQESHAGSVGDFACHFFASLFSQLPTELAVVLDDTYSMPPGTSCQEITAVRRIRGAIRHDSGGCAARFHL